MFCMYNGLPAMAERDELESIFNANYLTLTCILELLYSSHRATILLHRKRCGALHANTSNLN
jgi:hypothetical protein